MFLLTYFSATFHTKHFIIFLFSSGFILPVNNFFPINTFTISILLQICFVKYPSSDIKESISLNWLVFPLVFHHCKLLVYCGLTYRNFFAIYLHKFLPRVDVSKGILVVKISLQCPSFVKIKVAHCLTHMIFVLKLKMSLSLNQLC